MNLFAAVSLALTLTGTYALSAGFYIWEGLLALIIGVGGLFFSLGRPADALPGRSLTRLPRWSFHNWLCMGGRVGALLLSLAVGIAARHRDPRSDFTILFLFWLVALVGFIVTLVPRHWKQHLPSLSLSRREQAGLIILLVVAFLLRGVALGSIPGNFGGDEGTQALDGLRLAEHPLGNPFTTGWYTVPTMSLFAYGVSIRIFGATMAGARLLSALIGTLTVLTTFLLARSLGGKQAGWVAAIVVAATAYHIHFSRLASNQIADPLVATLALWLLWQALHATDAAQPSAAWGLTGMVVALGWYGYFGARWVGFLAGFFLVWRALVEPRFISRYVKGIGLMILGFLVVLLPLLLWYSAHPENLVARYHSVSIFASGWLAFEAQQTGQPVATLLLKQFFKAVTAFHYTPDTTLWYFPQAPLVDFLTGTMMLVGMVATVLRWRWPSRGLTLLWFWSTVLMAWGMTENPPSSQRGLLLVPAVALLVAWAVEALGEFFKYRETREIALRFLLAAIIVLNITFYFLIYTPRRVYGNPTSQVATEFAHYHQAHPLAGGTVYFLGPPVLYWDFGTLAFLLRDQPGVDVLPGELPETVATPARFVILGDRLGELVTLQSLYPGGRLEEVRASGSNALLFVIYDWSDTS